MADEETTGISVQYPKALHRRALKIKKAFGYSITTLLKEGLRDRVEFYEARLKGAKEANAAEAATKEETPGARKVKSLADRQEERLNAAEEKYERERERETKPDPVPAVEQPARQNQISSFYLAQAKHIFEVLHDPQERRLRAFEAVKAVKNRFPLTHPGDQGIMEILERLVFELKEKNAKRVALFDEANAPSPLEQRLARMVDAFADSQIDTSKVKSNGDIEENT